jgi:ferric-dicitrate binding protein FerR (iron transport regulator)
MDEKILKYFENEMSQTEGIEFLKQIESDDRIKQDFVNYQNVYALLHVLPHGKKDETEGKAGYIRFSHITKQKNIRRLFVKITAYAASVALLIMATWFVSSRHTSQSIAAITHELFVPAGQRARLTLDDGTVVWLNARSNLIYPAAFLGNERKVSLSSGEAFFEVTHDPDRPFTVSAQDLNITVLGTKFNVSMYQEEDDIQVALEEGSVRVWDAWGEEKILSANQQLSYLNKKMTVHTIEHLDYFLWKDGIYSFHKESFSSIIEKLRRYYDISIEVEDLPIMDLEYTGKFRQQDGVDMILRILQITHPFKIERNEDVIILRK